MLTVRSGRWIFIIKSLYDINRINALNGHRGEPHKHTADLPSSTHTPKQLLRIKHDVDR